MTTPSPQTSKLIQLDNQQQEEHLRNFRGFCFSRCCRETRPEAERAARTLAPPPDDFSTPESVKKGTITHQTKKTEQKTNESRLPFSTRALPCTRLKALKASGGTQTVEMFADKPPNILQTTNQSVQQHPVLLLSYK